MLAETYQYTNIGGIINTAEIRKNDPGRTCKYEVYTEVYKALATKGKIDSILAIQELIFPRSSDGTILDNIERGTIIAAPASKVINGAV